MRIVMSIISRATDATATNVTITDGSRNSIAPADGSEGDKWFARAVRELLPSDAGFILHKLTEVPASTCYRYANGQTQPTLYLYRKLLFHPHGFTWLSALMDGCDQSWWRELQAARDLLIKFKIEAR